VRGTGKHGAHIRIHAAEFVRFAPLQNQFPGNPNRDYQNRRYRNQSESQIRQVQPKGLRIVPVSSKHASHSFPTAEFPPFTLIY
jgi:hypothetical protein